MKYTNPLKNQYYLLGRRIQHNRIKRGYTQEKLANKVGMSLNYLGFIETGQKKPSVDMLLKLANALDVHPKEFWDF